MSETRQPEAKRHYGFDEITRALTTPEFFQDRYPLYARMRREHPVYRSVEGIWYVTRYADVEAALRDPRLSVDGERTTRTLEAGHEDLQPLSRLTRRFPRMMTNTDPPDHTRLRRLVSNAFTAGQVQGLRPRIQAIADELLDAAVAAGDTMDLIEAFASPLPASVIFELFGIPHHDRERVRAWFRELANLTGGLERIELTLEQFEDYLADLIHSRRAEPGDDIISALVTAQECGQQLSDGELLYTCFVILTAAGVPTINLIGNGTLALLRHPDQLRRLRQDPTMIRSAVDELLRYDTPTQILTRVVAGGAEIGGQTLDDGDLVHLVLGAANRDPEQFADPDQVDVGRRDNRHLSFGGGAHFCLGAWLARLEGEVAIGTLVRCLPALRLHTDTVEWQRNLILRGPVRLPVAY